MLISCTKEDIAAPTNAKTNNVESELKDEYSKALENVLQFQNLVSDNNTKSTTTLKVVSYNIEKINLQNNSRAKSIFSKDDNESVNVFQFAIESGGETGFAIASGDERIGRTYAFVEKGSLADTSRIEVMNYMIAQIPYVIAEI